MQSDQNNQDSSDITVNLPEDEGARLSDYKPQQKKIPQKEIAASWVAMGIVGIFAISLTLILIGGFLLILWSPHENSKALMDESIIPFLEKVGTFSTSVFGPLLAFILGYYFGERQTK